MEDTVDKNNIEQTETTNPQTERKQSAQEACLKQVAELTEKLTRLGADFDNFKRRTEKDRLHWISSGQQLILKDIITIVDDFERALSPASNQAHKVELNVWLSGFDMIHKSLVKLLSKYGVTVMPDVDQFDPEKHEALMSVASDKAPGTIMQVLEKGYMLHDKVLRPAKVSVAQ